MEVQIFKNPQFGEIRTIEVNGKPYFVANDVAKALGYSNPSKATNDHCKNAIKEWGNDSLGRQTEFKVIPEGDIYRLIVKSQLPQAEKFERWVFDEVLPSIRKHGSYVAKSSEKQDVEVLLTWANGVSDMLRLNSSSRLRYIQQIAQPLNLPVPDYTQSMGVLKSATELLRENNLSVSAKEFNRIAVERGYLVEMSRKSKGKDKYFKSVTELGREYGENQVSPHNPRETQPLWYRDRFTDLIKVLGLAIC